MQLGKRLARVWPSRLPYNPQKVLFFDGQAALLTAPLSLPAERCWACPNDAEPAVTLSLEQIEDTPTLCLVHAEEHLVALFRSSDDPLWYQIVLRALARAMAPETIDAEYA